MSDKIDIISELKSVVFQDLIAQDNKIEELANISGKTKTLLRQTLKQLRTELIKSVKTEEKKKASFEFERIRNERRAKKIEEEKEKQKNELLSKEMLDRLEKEYLICEYTLFQNVCEADYRKAYYYLAERLMHENKFITFKDNGDLIKYESDEGIYSQRADIFIATKVKEILGEKGLNFAVKEITDSIRRSTYQERSILFNQPKHLKPVKNGLWDIIEKKLLPFTPDHIFLDKIDIPYIEGADCPGFRKFLSEILADEKEVKVVQEWMGYCLLNDNRMQKAFLLYGDGANGKSVLLKVIKRFLGENNVANISLQHLENNTFALARLFSKSANIFFDLPKKALSQTSNFKIIVSGDSVSGEKKGKDSFEYVPYCKMMFSCNEVPRTPDRTPAFFRRWIVLKFLQKFEGDRRVENKEQEFFTDSEMRGILIFALEGLYRLLEQKKFTEHMRQAEVEQFWIRHSDSVSAFVLDMVEKDLTAEEPKTQIYDSYVSYCKSQGYTEEEQNHFWRRFKELVEFSESQPRGDGYSGRIIKGVRLNAIPGGINNGG